jgi:hypothetical protein
VTPENNNAPSKRTQRKRIHKAVKRAIIKSVKAGERPAELAKRFNLKPASVYSIINTQRNLSLVAIRKGIKLKRFVAVTPAQTATTTPDLSADAANKLRDIALFCEVDKAEALSACVIFYYKHLREVVQQRIKA